MNKNENLERWINAVEILIRKNVEIFESTSEFSNENVKRMVGIKHKIKDMMDLIEDYATTKGIVLSKYLKTYHKDKIINNFFSTFYERNPIGFTQEIATNQDPDPDDDFDIW